MQWLLLPAMALASLLSLFDPNLPLAILLSLTALAGGWQMATGKWQMGAFPAPLSWCMLLFGLWAGVSTLWTATPFDSWRMMSIWLLLPIWTWLLAALEPRQLKPVLIGVAAIVYALALIAFSQLHVLSIDPNYRPQSLFANPNTFAALLVALLLPLQHLWLGRAAEIKSKAVRIGSAVLLAILFAALVLTVSRIALFGYAAFTAIQMVFLRDIVKTHWRWVLGYFIVFALVYFGINSGTDDMVDRRIGYITHPISTSERILVWQTSWSAFLQAPLFGHGFAALSVPYAALRQHDDGTYGQFAHSDALQYLAELGPLGLLLAGAMALSFVVMTISRLRAGFANPNDRLWFSAAACGVLVTIAAATVTYVLYLPAILLIVALLLGLWSSIYWAHETEAPPRVRKPAMAAVFTLVMLPLIALHLSGLMTANADAALRQYSLKDHLKWNLWASHLSFDLNPRVLLEWEDVLMAQASQERKPEQFAQAEHLLTRLERLQPSLPQLWLHRARYDLARRDYDLAETHMRKAIALDPVFLEGRLMLGKLLRERHEGDEADALYAQALEWKAIRDKYGIKSIEDLQTRESNLPRLTKSR